MKINDSNFCQAHNLHLIAIKIQTNYMFEKYLHLFDDNIVAKIMGYHFRRDRVVAFTSELLKHYYLANYLGINCNDIKIAYTNFGRPFLLINPQNIDFNISHSGEYVIMAITKNAKIGIDIEKINYDISPSELSNQVYSLFEQELAGNSVENFFIIWTKKEAFLKSLGQGFMSDSYQTTSLNLCTKQVTKIDNISYLTIFTKFATNYFIALSLSNA